MIKWRKLPRGARWFLFGIVLVIGATIALLLWPAPPPVAGPLPQPNGYDAFVEAAASVAQAVADYRQLPETKLREVVNENAAALKLMRTGLDRECRVPLKFSTEDIHNHFPQLGGHKLLAQALQGEARLAEMEGRTNDAARSCLDAIRLGHECARGGLLIDHLVGQACEAIGSHQLMKLVLSLDAKTCRHIASGLESIAGRRESPDETLRLELAWSRRVGGLSERIRSMTMFRSFNPARTLFNTSYLPRLQMEMARQSQLTLDLATRAYTLERGRPPAHPSDLVPTYLRALPSTNTSVAPPAR